MILVDTSVWIDHLRAGKTELTQLLDGGRVLMHPFIIGEVALGNLRQRDNILTAMRLLPAVNVATDPEVLHFIQKEMLFGHGIGYVDAHLLAAIRLTPDTSLWTRDRRLGDAAGKLGLVAGGINGLYLHRAARSLRRRSTSAFNSCASTL